MEQKFTIEELKQVLSDMFYKPVKTDRRSVLAYKQGDNWYYQDGTLIENPEEDLWPFRAFL